MISKDHSPNAPGGRECYFKRITLGMTGDWTQHRKASLFIVRPRRQHNSRPPSCLFPSGLGCEIYPDKVPGFGHIFPGYHISLPAGCPQSVSPCWFSAVMPDTNFSRVGFCFGFRILTLPGPSTSTSRSSPVLSFAAKATGFGIRTARLFPHFASCVFIGPLVSTEYILLRWPFALQTAGGPPRLRKV